MAEDEQGGSPETELWSKSFGSLYVSQCLDRGIYTSYLAAVIGESQTSYSLVETMKAKEQYGDTVVECKT